MTARHSRSDLVKLLIFFAYYVDGNGNACSVHML
eukprot:03034.XXX_7160_11925_1 [CDS] Oithona nana genome sequencing.